ncbi:hypothetical protein [[Mycoplasma] mobile]|nr:hypothetical protein [[Mycoplasma] mobile]
MKWKIFTSTSISIASIIAIVAPTTVVLVSNSNTESTLNSLKKEIQDKIEDRIIRGSDTILPTALNLTNLRNNILGLPNIDNLTYFFKFTNQATNSNGGNNFNGSISIDITLRLNGQEVLLENQLVRNFRTNAFESFANIKVEPFNAQTLRPNAFSDFRKGLPPSNIFKLSLTTNVEEYLIIVRDETSVSLRIKGTDPSDNINPLDRTITVSGFVSRNDPQGIANLAIQRIDNFESGTIALKPEYLNNSFQVNLINNENLITLINRDFELLLGIENINNITYSISYKIESFNETSVFARIIITISRDGVPPANSQTSRPIEIIIRKMSGSF